RVRRPIEKAPGIGKDVANCLRREFPTGPAPLQPQPVRPNVILRHSRQERTTQIRFKHSFDPERRQLLALLVSPRADVGLKPLLRRRCHRDPVLRHRAFTSNRAKVPASLLYFLSKSNPAILPALTNAGVETGAALEHALRELRHLLLLPGRNPRSDVAGDE